MAAHFNALATLAENAVKESNDASAGKFRPSEKDFGRIKFDGDSRGRRIEATGTVFFVTRDRTFNLVRSWCTVINYVQFFEVTAITEEADGQAIYVRALKNKAQPLMPGYKDVGFCMVHKALELHTAVVPMTKEDGDDRFASPAIRLIKRPCTNDKGLCGACFEFPNASRQPQLPAHVVTNCILSHLPRARTMQRLSERSGVTKTERREIAKRLDQRVTIQRDANTIARANSMIPAQLYHAPWCIEFNQATQEACGNMFLSDKVQIFHYSNRDSVYYKPMPQVPTTPIPFL